MSLKRKILQVIIVFSLFLFLGTGVISSYAQEAFISVSVDKNKIYQDENIVLKIVLAGIAEGDKLDAPNLDDFEIISKLESNQTEIINGEYTYYKILRLVLAPKRTGNFKIDSFVFKHDKQAYRSDVIDIKVLDKQAVASTGSPSRPIPYGKSTSSAATDAVQGQPVDVIENEPYFVELTSSHDEVFVGQQVNLIFRFNCRGIRLLDYKYMLPRTADFMEESLGEDKNYYRTINGARYAVWEFRTALFPLRVGEHIISPAEIEFIYADGGWISNRYRQKLVTRPIKIKVKPLPEENKPDNFNNAVGDFKVRTTVSPKKVKVGEPVTLNIRVQGAGNVKNIKFLDMDDVDGFKSYDSEIKDMVDYDENTVVGLKTLEKIYVPKWGGIHSFKIPEFSFFNPYKKEYVIVKSAPVEINVAELSAEEKRQSSLISSSSNTDADNTDIVNVSRLNSDINFIKTKSGVFVKRKNNLFFYLAVFLFPFVIVACLFLYSIKRDKLKTDAKYARKVKAGRSLNRTLKKANKAVKKGNVSEFYLYADKALSDCISNKTAVSSAGMTAHTAVDLLQDKNISDNIIEDVRNIFNQCDMVKFVSASVSKEDAEKDCEKLKEVISILLKKL